MNVAETLTTKEVQKHIAQQLKAARMLRHATQKQCGKVLEVTFQQFQKYETNLNKITAADLFMLARYLHQPIESFFPSTTGIVDAVGALSASTETVRAAEAFHSINDDATRDSVLGLLKTLSKREMQHV